MSGLLGQGTLVANRFTVERVAGTGGMGAVYRALDGETGSVVALKLAQLSTQAQDAERFLRESQVLSTLQHPGIVGYVAHGRTADGQLYLAMEWLEGESVADRLRRAPLTIAESVTLLRRTAEALSVAHKNGILHRDLKPSNLFLVGGNVDKVKVLDFGIARQLTSGTGVTRTGLVIGTPEYMAPEQARGIRELTPAVDIFALGCLLYECLAGQAPFAAEHVAAVLVRILLDDPPPLHSRRVGIPESVSALVQRMLSKDPDRRPKDALALLAEIPEVGDISSDELIPRDRTAPISSGSLTGREQALVSVIMVCLPESSGPRPALVDTPGPMPKTPSPLTSVGHPSLLDVMERLGARAEWLVDGSLVVTISRASSATDQAALSARCALLLRERFPTAELALATGRGVVAGSLPTGEAVDRAASLLRSSRETRRGAAAVGSGVLIDSLTARLLDGRFAVRETPEGMLLAGDAVSNDESRPLLGQATPCVGREQELAMLEATLNGCIDESELRTVLVSALPGVGKSRLRHEFLRRLSERSESEVAVLLGWADPMSSSTPYSVFASALRRYFELDGVAAGEPQRQRLQAAVRGLVPESEAVKTAVLIGEVCGLSFPESAHPSLAIVRSQPARRRELLSEVVVTLLRSIASQKPLALVLEDLHWADSLSIDLCDSLRRALEELPVLLLLLGRPEFKEQHPQFAAGRLVELQLHGLSKRAGERLVKAVLGSKASPETIARIVQQSEGNALLLEELIRAAAEGHGDAVPETVLAMFQARLGRLSSDARRLLCLASVFGQVFRPSELSSLVSPEATVGAIEPQLKILLQDELIEVQSAKSHGVSLTDAGAVSKDLPHRFRHALVRDAAYGLLTVGDRVVLHRIIGQRAESASLAQAHYEHALAANASLGGSADSKRQRVELILGLISHARANLAAERSFAVLNEADQLVESLLATESRPEDQKSHVLVRYWLGFFHYYANEQQKAIAYFNGIIGDLQDDALMPLPVTLLGRVYSAQGHFGKAIGMLEKLVPLVPRWAELRELVLPTSIGFLAISLVENGQVTRALALGKQVVDAVVPTRIPALIAGTVGPYAAAQLLAGDLESAQQSCEVAYRAAEQSGNRLFLYLVSGIQGWLACRRGRLTEAEEHMARSQEAGSALGAQLVYSDWFAAGRAAIALEKGEAEKARELLSGLVAVTAKVGALFAGGVAHRLLAQAQAALGAAPEVVNQHLAESLAQLQRGEAHMEVAATELTWAELALGQGDRTAAEARYRSALATYQRCAADFEVARTTAVGRRLGLYAESAS